MQNDPCSHPARTRSRNSPQDSINQFCAFSDTPILPKAPAPTAPPVVLTVSVVKLDQQNRHADGKDVCEPGWRKGNK